MEKRKNLLRMTITTMMVFAMLLGSVVSSFAATQEGKGGKAFDGPTVNTFAAGLPLATVYLDPDVIRKGPSGKPQINGDKFTTGGTSGKNAQIDKKKIKFNEEYNNLGDFTYTYTDAAVFPDGSKGDVVVKMSVVKLLTANGDGTDDSLIDAKIVFTDMDSDSSVGSGYELSIGGGPGSNSTGTWGVWAHVDTAITITKGDGDFIIPANGANINKSAVTTYYKALYDLDSDNHKYTRETIAFPDTNVFYPIDNVEDVFKKDGKVYVRAKGGKGNKDYSAGMATIGKSGHTVTFQGMGSSSSNNQDRSNVMNLSLGDLQHRITSGSGAGGRIDTGKNGKGTDLEGGTFTGDISAISGTEKTTRRYVVPDAKAGVTYTMTPDSGYALEKVVVDGEEYTVPDTPFDTYALENNDGSGTLKHAGNGVFTYSFDKANTKDHTIYVTWKKVKRDVVRDATVKQDIIYTYLTAKGETAAATYTRTVDVQQKGTEDLVAGTTTWDGEWKTDGGEDPKLQAKTSPSVQNGQWVANIDEVPELPVNPKTDTGVTYDNATKTFTYEPIHVIYQPKDTGEESFVSKDAKYQSNGKDFITQTSGSIDLKDKLKTEKLPDESPNVITGHKLIDPSGKEVAGTKLTTSQGTYELIDKGASCEIKFTPSESFLDTADPVIVQSTDKLSEKLKTVISDLEKDLATATGDKKTEIEKLLTEYRAYRAPRAIYTPTVYHNKEVKTISRYVTFTYWTVDGQTASQTVTQTLTFERVGTYNKVSGQIDYPAWTPQTFPEVEAPKIDGWTPDVNKVASLTVSDPDKAIAPAHVVYKKAKDSEDPDDEDDDSDSDTETTAKKKAKAANTGDITNIAVWAALMGATVASASLMLLRRRRQK